MPCFSKRLRAEGGDLRVLHGKICGSSSITVTSAPMVR